MQRLITLELISVNYRHPKVVATHHTYPCASVGNSGFRSKHLNGTKNYHATVMRRMRILATPPLIQTTPEHATHYHQATQRVTDQVGKHVGAHRR